MAQGSSAKYDSPDDLIRRGYWLCDCGQWASGDVCFSCGTTRQQLHERAMMIHSNIVSTRCCWTCVCGDLNVDDSPYCSCGRSRESGEVKGSPVLSVMAMPSIAYEDHPAFRRP